MKENPVEKYETFHYWLLHILGYFDTDILYVLLSYTLCIFYYKLYKSNKAISTKASKTVKIVIANMWY